MSLCNGSERLDRQTLLYLHRSRQAGKRSINCTSVTIQQDAVRASNVRREFIGPDIHHGPFSYRVQVLKTLSIQRDLATISSSCFIIYSADIFLRIMEVKSSAKCGRMSIDELELDPYQEHPLETMEAAVNVFKSSLTCANSAILSSFPHPLSFVQPLAAHREVCISIIRCSIAAMSSATPPAPSVSFDV